jgi:hypothetical protein
MPPRELHLVLKAADASVGWVVVLVPVGARATMEVLTPRHARAVAVILIACRVGAAVEPS